MSRRKSEDTMRQSKVGTAGGVADEDILEITEALSELGLEVDNRPLTTKIRSTRVLELNARLDTIEANLRKAIELLRNKENYRKYLQ